MRTRAERRADTERYKARFWRKQKHQPRWPGTDASAGMHANHGKTCSCWMCGNPRRHLGQVTLDENWATDAFLDGMASIVDGFGTFRL